LTDGQTVHIIDDDPDVLRAIAFMVRTAGLAVCTYESALAFLNAGPTNRHGCIVTDIRMPGMNGLELQRRLTAENCRTPIIIMTAHADVALAVEAMKAGARDIIEKPFEYDVLLDAIKGALAGQKEVREAADRSAEIRGRLKLLSARERQVLEGLVAGKPNKIIAHDLELSVRTVEGYRATVMGKMQARSLPALISLLLSDPTVL
jgi:two-component system, LuxR family, response regulator FixJ